MKGSTQIKGYCQEKETPIRGQLFAVAQQGQLSLQRAKRELFQSCKVPDDESTERARQGELRSRSNSSSSSSSSSSKLLHDTNTDCCCLNVPLPSASHA